MGKVEIKTAERDMVRQLAVKKLEDAAFVPFQEFTAVDSLIYKNSDIGFYTIKELRLAGTAVHHETLKIALEFDAEIEIKLMGKSCDFADYEEFAEKCQRLYRSFAGDRTLLTSGLELGKVYQAMPLKRLARTLVLNMHICLEEDENENN